MLTFIAVSAVLFLSDVSAQAPGDHDPACRTGFNTDSHIFPAEWRILVDTYDYSNLYGPGLNPAWTVHDEDGDGNVGFMQFVGGSCTWTIRTCTNQATQDNWLVSQFISYEDAIEIFFNVTYRFTECFSRNSCNKPYLTLFSYNRDDIASDTEKTDFDNNYQLLLDIESSRLEQPQGSSTSIGETLNLIRPANSNGFYLGLRDEGTCGNVERLIVYYVVCPAGQEGLVSYPETAVPVRGSSDNIFDATCVPNAHNITTLQVTAFSDNSSCVPLASGRPMCECNLGYILSEDGMSCEACSAGSYRSATNDICQPCPGNTVIDVVAASECSCIDGFYRSTSQEEGPETGCTEPPSGCTNIEVTTRTATSLSVIWSGPTITGRSDYFYRVLYSNPDAIGEFVLANDGLIDLRNNVSYEVTGLIPFTSYIVRVTTHNGVSDQDPQNSHLRQCEVSDMTLEKIPGMPDNVIRLCTVIVWQSPSEPNGNILSYDIEFMSEDPESQLPPNYVQSHSANEGFHLTTMVERSPGAKVRVRAINGAGKGEWTPFEALGCADSDTCPTSEPRPETDCPTSTCPPSIPALRFELQGTTYLNNTVVVLDDIAEGEDALLCITNNEQCCGNGGGEFYYPDESQVRIPNSNDDIYRNRGSQLIRLNRKNDAMSPTGRFRCEIPDTSGILQSIFITIVSFTVPTTCSPCLSDTTPTCETCPACPTTPSVADCPTEPPTCPVCPTTLPPVACQTCPTPTCPTTSTTTCPDCPVATCPDTPDSDCPTQDTSSLPLEQALRFELQGTTYLNNTVVVLDNIAEGDDALLCITNNEQCCGNGGGEFYYPDESQVRISSSNDDIYRNRGSQLIRLNRRNDATSPTGRYRCEILDTSGILQSIFITIDTTPTCETCPACPTTPPVADCPTEPPTCPVCPTPTCPTTSTTTCPDCPVVTCPDTPDSDCPTQDTPLEPALRFELQGTTYLNNTVVVLDNIAEGEDALLCITNNEQCCGNGGGEFYYPDESQVRILSSNDDIYRNRGSQLIRLNRRNGAMSPTGRFRCEIPDVNGMLQSILINIVSTDTTCSCPTCPTCQSSTCPDPIECQNCPSDCPDREECPDVSCPTVIIEETLEVKDVIETNLSFVAALSSPATDEKIELEFREILATGVGRRQTSTIITIDIGAIMGKYLIVISKEKFKEKLIKGSSYAITITNSRDSIPFIFEYREDIPAPTTSNDGNNDLVTYVVVTAIIACVLTAIVAGVIIALVVYFLSKKNKSSKYYANYAEKNPYFPTKNSGTEMTEKI